MKTSAPSSRPRRAGLAAAVATTLLVSGCATVEQPTPRDPWEGYNRAMFAFNDTVDGAVLKPIAYAYRDLTPQPVRSCVSNVFGNFADVWSAFNSFLQARGHDFFNTLGRVLFNSTMGLGGCFDVATKNGAHKIPNDLGTTLGVWGFGSGPYVVLPFLGPNTVRDATAFIGGFAIDVSPLTPVMELDNVSVRNSLLGTYIVSTRANLLDADELVNRTALDRYSFIRDAYLQRRDALVNSRRTGGDSLPDYSDADVPDYTDPDPEASNATTAAPSATR
jgi:Surface lipoprotein